MWTSIQIQPDVCPKMDLEAAIMAISSHGPILTSRGNDNGRYVNVAFNSKGLRQAKVRWAKVKRELGLNKDLARCTIVVREGKNGWSDYVLLHTYVRSAKRHVKAD